MVKISTFLLADVQVAVFLRTKIEINEHTSNTKK